MALSFHYCRVRTIRAAIFQSRLPRRHAYNNYSRDFNTLSRVQYPRQFSRTPTHIKPQHSSGFLYSVLPKDRRERLGRWSAYTGIGMIGLLGAFWLWNQEKVPITGRKRFNFISHEYLENNEHKNFLMALLLHHTMAITRHNPSVLLPADHPMNVVVQRVFYRLLKAQGQDSSGWKICVVRARGNSYPFASGHESQRLTFSDINRVIGAANKQVLVYTGALPVCQDEAGLASVIAHQIAARIMEPHSEVISHHYFVRLSAVPAIPLIISAFLLPQTAVIAAPYLALWVAYAWTRDAACKTLVEQDRYAGTMVMARAGYDIHAGIGYWVRYLQREERKIAEIGRLNSPIHREVHNKSLT
jgi:hypothetical protein